MATIVDVLNQQGRPTRTGSNPQPIFDRPDPFRTGPLSRRRNELSRMFLTPQTEATLASGGGPLFGGRGADTVTRRASQVQGRTLDERSPEGPLPTTPIQSPININIGSPAGPTGQIGEGLQTAVEERTAVKAQPQSLVQILMDERGQAVTGDTIARAEQEGLSSGAIAFLQKNFGQPVSFDMIRRAEDEFGLFAKPPSSQTLVGLSPREIVDQLFEGDEEFLSPVAVDLTEDQVLARFGEPGFDATAISEATSRGLIIPASSGPLADAAVALGASVRGNRLADPKFLANLRAGRLPPLSSLSLGFLRSLSPSITEALTGLYESGSVAAEDLAFELERFRPVGLR